MSRPVWTEEDAETQRREDAKAKPYLKEGLGCVRDGCIYPSILSIILVIPLAWYLN